MKFELEVVRRQGDFTLDTTVIAAGQRIGLFGPSGSGKTTFMHLLAGLVRADWGHLRVNDDLLFCSNRHINLKPEQRRIGVVFQHAHLFPHMGVRRNLLYGYRRIPAAARKIDPAMLIDVLGLAPLMERGVSSLSGGERQRVALGRTVLACPQLMLLDEPMTGLDENLKYQIIPYLKAVFTEFEIPFILISHSLKEMRLMTDHVWVMNGGQVTAQTTAEELARGRIGNSGNGYSNLMELSHPVARDGLYGYRWGKQALVLTAGTDEGKAMFELASKDVTLFKRDPEATSARNLLHCRVKRLFGSGNRVGVELDCGDGKTLVSEVVHEAVADLGLSEGTTVVAVIKASAFRRMY